VVVHNLYVDGIAVCPTKADMPSFIDANAVLPLPVPGELLQPIPGWNSKIIEPFCGIENQEFPESDPLDFGWESRRPRPIEQLLRVFRREADYHEWILTHSVMAVKRCYLSSSA